MIKKILLLFSLFLSGCGIEYGEEYTVYIHPAFGTKSEYVVEALSKWSEAVGVTYFPAIEEPKDCIKSGNICMYIANEEYLHERLIVEPEPDEIYGLTTRNVKDYASIWILDQLVVEASEDLNQVSWENFKIKSVVLHELGHSLGLAHDPHEGAVMCRYAQCSSTQISCWDKKQYFNLRDIEYSCNK